MSSVIPPEEIAAAVLWRCSDEATFAIGHALESTWRGVLRGMLVLGSLQPRVASMGADS